MAKKTEELCADRDSLTGLADIGDEFIKAMKVEAYAAKELGLDTTELDAILKKATTTLKATRKRLRL